jgi:hypothetical protein
LFLRIHAEFEKANATIQATARHNMRNRKFVATFVATPRSNSPYGVNLLILDMATAEEPAIRQDEAAAAAAVFM